MMPHTEKLLEILHLRDAIHAALDDLASDHPALAHRRLRRALSTQPPGLRAELSAARAVVKAARTYIACVGVSPGIDGATDTAYRILAATLTIADRVGVLFAERDAA